MDKHLLIELLPKSLPGGNVVLGESARGLLLKEVSCSWPVKRPIREGFIQKRSRMYCQYIWPKC